jgi:hypothetical protein
MKKKPSNWLFCGFAVLLAVMCTFAGCNNGTTDNDTAKKSTIDKSSAGGDSNTSTTDPNPFNGTTWKYTDTVVEQDPSNSAETITTASEMTLAFGNTEWSETLKITVTQSAFPSAATVTEIKIQGTYTRNSASAILTTTHFWNSTLNPPAWDSNLSTLISMGMPTTPETATISGNTLTYGGEDFTKR